MSMSATAAKLERPDDFYADLLAAHEGLGKAGSDALNARLILLMANEIGDRMTLKRLLEEASAGRS